MTALTSRIAVLSLAIVVDAVFFLDLCDLIFDCGCEAGWAGAADACNIHHDAPPHCPWCAAGWLVGGVLPFGAIVLGQALVALPPLPIHLGVRLAASLALLPIIGYAVGLIFALATGYPL